MSGTVWALLAVRVLLAGLFALAGVAKLADLASFRQAVSNLGMPFAGALSVLVPLSELAVAGALLVGRSAWWGALAAAVLLVAFSVVLGIARVRGRRADCNCFGMVYASSAGWPEIVRNVFLGFLAALLVAAGPEAASRNSVEAIGDLTKSELVALSLGVTAGATLAVAGWLLIRLRGENRRLRERIEALEGRTQAASTPPTTPPSPSLYASLPLETPAPAFELVDLDGGTQTLASLREADKSVLLIFSDPACGPCSTLLPQIGRWQRDLAEKVTIALISRGSRQANFESAARYGLRHVLLQQDREVATLYHAYGTPSGVLIRPDGTIGSALAAGGQEISSVVATATAEVTMDDSGSDRVWFNDEHHAH